MVEKTEFIELTPVNIPVEAEELVLSVIQSGQISQGKLVQELETEFAKFIDVEHAIAVNNGTSALTASLKSLKLTPEDEVITSPFTFVATLNAILKSGATIRFADITEEDFSINPKEVENSITNKTKAILPVHLFGQSSDMESISSIADEKSLKLIEDASQAHGASCSNKQVGTWGIGCFSLYATKNLTSGEGGLVTTNDDRIADFVKLFRNQGMRKKYSYEIIGENLRLTDRFSAFFLLASRRDG